MSLSHSFLLLGAGLSVGLAGIPSGFAIGIVGDAGVRGTAQQPKLYVGMVSAALSSRQNLTIIDLADFYVLELVVV